MYVSDYGYSAYPSAWSTNLCGLNGNNYSKTEIVNNNWIHMQLYEWTITPRYDTQYVFSISPKGWIDETGRAAGSYRAVRPTFYLNSDVSYVSGSGTKASPYIIN